MIGPEERAAVLEVLDSGVLSGFLGEQGDSFMGGPWVKACEAAFARRMGSDHALTFNSGTTALEAAIASVVQPGDEVIVPALTMSATAAAVLLAGASPVFADVEDETFGLDPASVAERITPKTKAIIAVHLFGHPCRMDDLAKFDLPLIEDAAQSIGATYKGKPVGTIGVAGMLSLNRHKIISCGEGGVLLTDDRVVAETAPLIRNHGEAVGSEVVGSNYRMCEIEAAIATEQLKKLDFFIYARQVAAKQLAGRIIHGPRLCRGPVVANDCTHVFWRFPMLVEDRANVAKRLREVDIEVAEGYAPPVHLQPIYRHRFAEGFCPVAERLWKSDLLLISPFAGPDSVAFSLQRSWDTA
jgi:perosamine synthetase